MENSSTLTAATRPWAVRGRCAVIVVIGALGWTPSGDARAQDAYACIETLSDDAVQYRITKIEKTFADGQNKARGWRIGWIVGLVGLGSAQVVLALDAAQDDKPWDEFHFAYGAAATYAFALGLLLTPMTDVWGLKRIRRQPDGTPEERRAKLRYATDLLEKGAKIEAAGRSALPIVGGAVVGIVGGTVKAAKWPGRSPGFTAMSYLLPPAGGAVIALTAPKHLPTRWEAYRGMACSEQYYQKPREQLDFDLSVNGPGMSFSLRF